MKIEYPKVEVKSKDELVDTVIIKEKELVTSILSVNAIVPRGAGILRDKAFYLGLNYNWIIVKDDLDDLCLIPLKKTGD